MVIDYAGLFALIQGLLEFAKQLDILIFTQVTLNSIWAYVLLSLGGSAVNGLDHFRDGLTKNEAIVIIQGAIVAVFIAVICYAQGSIDAYYMSIVGFLAPFIWVRLVKKAQGFFQEDSGELSGEVAEGEADSGSGAGDTGDTVDSAAVEADISPLLEKALKEAEAKT